MNIEMEIKKLYTTMTKAEQQVADCVLSHQHDFLFYTLDRAAQEAGTSTTSVIRFCRRLGFAGYKSFQEKFQQESKLQFNLPGRLRNISNGASVTDLFERIIQEDIQNIFQSFEDVSLEAINEAVSLLSTAKNVYAFGMRESYSLAHYLYTRMTTIRKNVHILDAGYNGMYESILDLASDDVCVVFLFHRYTSQTLQILPRLKKQGIPIILITSAPFDSVAPYAKVLLPCLVQIRGIKNSFVVPVCMIDYFCNAVAAFAPKASLARLELIEEML